MRVGQAGAAPTLAGLRACFLDLVESLRPFAGSGIGGLRANRDREEFLNNVVPTDLYCDGGPNRKLWIFA